MKHLFYILLCFVFITSCEKENSTLQPGNEEDFKFIDTTELIGSISLPFPLVTEPEFVSVNSVDFLNSSDNVYIYKSQNQTFIYPIKNLSVEVVNHLVNDEPIAMTYCPITGSGLAINRTIKGDTLLFRASGMRYKENLMPYDNTNESVWSQMLIKCVRGKYVGHSPEVLSIVETDWQQVKKVYPEAEVLAFNPDEKHENMQYLKKSVSAPGPGNEDDEDDHSISDNSKVFGVLQSTGALIAEYTDFPVDSIGIKKHSGSKTTFVGSQNPAFIMAFKTESSTQFYPVQNSLPIVMKDDNGNYYNWFGEASNGPSHGKRLETPSHYYMAYWWAWKNFFSNFTHIK